MKQSKSSYSQLNRSFRYRSDLSRPVRPLSELSPQHPGSLQRPTLPAVRGVRAHRSSVPVSDLSRPVRPWSELSPQHPGSLQRPTLPAVRGVRAHRSSVTRFRPLPSRQTVIWAHRSTPGVSSGPHCLLWEEWEHTDPPLPVSDLSRPVRPWSELSPQHTPGVSSGPHCLLWEEWERTDPPLPVSDLSRPVRPWSELSPQHPESPAAHTVCCERSESAQILRYPFQTSPVPSDRDLSSHRSTPGVSSGPHCLLWEEWEHTDPPLPVSTSPVRQTVIWALTAAPRESPAAHTVCCEREWERTDPPLPVFRSLPSRQTVIWALTAAPQESPAAHTVCCERSETAQILRYPFQTSPVPSDRDLSSHRSTPGVSSGPHCLRERSESAQILRYPFQTSPSRQDRDLSSHRSTPGSLQRPTLPAVRGVRAHRSSVTRFRPLPSRQSVIWALTAATPGVSSGPHCLMWEEWEHTDPPLPVSDLSRPVRPWLSSHRSTPGVSSGPHCLLWEEWERTDPPLPVSDLSRPVRPWSELSPQHPGVSSGPHCLLWEEWERHRSSVTRFRPLPSRQTVIWALTAAPRESPAAHTACCERNRFKL